MLKKKTSRGNPLRRTVAEMDSLSRSHGSSHKRAPKQEREIASRVGGRLVPRSGAGDEKGDVRIRRVARIEAKTTRNKSFSVTLDMMNKIEDAATLAGEMPVIVVEFVSADGRSRRSLAVCPMYVLDAIAGGSDA